MPDRISKIKIPFPTRKKEENQNQHHEHISFTPSTLPLLSPIKYRLRNSSFSQAITELEGVSYTWKGKNNMEAHAHPTPIPEHL